MKPIIKKIAFLQLILILLAGSAFAQTDNLCVFKETTALYVPLGDEIDITSTVFIPDSYYVMTTPIGLFPLLGQQWDIDYNNRTLVIYANGRVYLALDTAFALFDCLYTDTMEILDATSKVSYWLEGIGNQQILKVQWKNLHIGPGPAGNYFNVQMWFYKTTGVIEFRYGPRSANNATGYNTAGTVGIFAGIWHSNNNFTMMYEKIQVKGLPPNIQIDSVLNTNVPHIQGVPAEGTVYRFVPKAVAASVGVIEKGYEMSITPNPAINKVNISFGLPVKGDIAIVNAMGSVVYEAAINEERSVDISTGNFAPGMYYIKVSGRDGEQVKPLSITR